MLVIGLADLGVQRSIQAELRALCYDGENPGHF